MHLGIVSEMAAKIARESGMEVVMDRCMKKRFILNEVFAATFNYLEVIR